MNKEEITLTTEELIIYSFYNKGNKIISIYNEKGFISYKFNTKYFNRKKQRNDFKNYVSFGYYNQAEKKEFDLKFKRLLERGIKC